MVDRSEEDDIVEWLLSTEIDMAKIPRELDMNRIDRRLFQGAVPPYGHQLKELGFDVIVLCAAETQPTEEELPGLTILRMPSSDYKHIPPTKEHIAQVEITARAVANHIEEGRNVLVTCFGGFNRSGFVSAMVLHYLYDWPGEDCVRLVKAKRDFALHNKRFAGYLESITPRKGR